MMKFFVLITFSIFLLASPALAIEPLVHCGGTGQPLCTTCDFLVLGKNISDFVLDYLTPAIAALLFIYAGFEILLGGGIPARVDRGRKVFQTTAYGLAIIFLAWLIVNTVLRTVAGDENIAQNWWKLECRESITTGVTDNGGNNNLPPNVSPETNGGGNNNELPPNIGTSPTASLLPSPSNQPAISLPPDNLPLRSPLFSPNIPPVPSFSPPAPSPSNTAGALTCKFSGVNLCQAGGSCPTNACSQYSAAIQKAAAATPINGLNSAALIRAFMFNESSCNVLAKNTTVSLPSCGLMQLQASTANRFKTQCGITANITCDWLTNSANAEASICIAAKYIKSIAGGTCGSEVRNIAAGYNGGVGACGASNDCKNDKSCDGGTARKWECLYDSQPAPLHCNTGYDETRGYAPKVAACYNVNK